MLKLIHFVYASEVVDAHSVTVFVFVNEVVARQHEDTEPRGDLPLLFFRSVDVLDWALFEDDKNLLSFVKKLLAHENLAERVFFLGLFRQISHDCKFNQIFVAFILHWIVVLNNILGIVKERIVLFKQIIGVPCLVIDTVNVSKTF